MPGPRSYSQAVTTYFSFLPFGVGSIVRMQVDCYASVWAHMRMSTQRWIALPVCRLTCTCAQADIGSHAHVHKQIHCRRNTERKSKTCVIGKVLNVVGTIPRTYFFYSIGSRSPRRRSSCFELARRHIQPDAAELTDCKPRDTQWKPATSLRKQW